MKKRVFIVDDEIDLLDFYTEAIELGGHLVIDTAMNGAEAVIKFSSMIEKPDVIVMDHRMPVKNGLDATREILKMDPNMKVIFASADDTIELEAMKLGVRIFNKKPFSFDKLIANLNKI